MLDYKSSCSRTSAFADNVKKYFNYLNLFSLYKMPKYKGKVILVDIEGTTTSISFVKDILFPYAKDHCNAFLKKNWTEDSIRSLVDELKNLPQYTEFLVGKAAADSSTDLERTTEFVQYLIEKDLKLKPLKSLQGLIWEHGYKDGTLIGHVYDDVPIAFKHWQQNGLQIAVYSSGSIWAQKLLFGQTNHGNLLTYLCAHFDTTSGMKTESQSYRNIAKALAVETSNVVFLTDISKEAAAATEAGMQTALLSRPGNAALTDEEKASYYVIHSFDELDIQLQS